MTRPRLLFKNGVHLNAVPQLSWCYINGIKLLMICLLDDGRCLVFICSPLLMAIFVLHFILFAEGRLSFLFCVDMWFVLTFVLVQVNAWGVSPWGSPHLFCWDLPTIASTFVSDMACSLVSFSLKCRPPFRLLHSSPFLCHLSAVSLFF